MNTQNKGKRTVRVLLSSAFVGCVVLSSTGAMASASTSIDSTPITRQQVESNSVYKDEMALIVNLKNATKVLEVAIQRDEVSISMYESLATKLNSIGARILADGVFENVDALTPVLSSTDTVLKSSIKVEDASILAKRTESIQALTRVQDMLGVSQEERGLDVMADVIKVALKETTQLGDTSYVENSGVQVVSKAETLLGTTQYVESSRVIQRQAALASNSKITVTINGTKQSYAQPPVMKSGTTLVPLRGIFESLGAKVDYNAKTQAITATKGSTKVKLTIGSKKATVNGKSITLAVPAQTINGSTMVPLRFVSEALGANVNWNPSTNTVTIQADGVAVTPSKPADSGQVVNGIKALYGNHTYGVKNQTEYDAVMEVIKDRVKNVNTETFEAPNDVALKAFNDYLNGKRPAGNTREDKFLQSAGNAVQPLLDIGLSNTEIITIYNLSQLQVELNSGADDPQDGSPRSAYDGMFRKLVDCDVQAQVQSAVFDQAGYSTFIEGGSNHAEAFIVLKDKVYQIVTGKLVPMNMTFSQYKSHLSQNKMYLISQPIY